ncbi:aldose epimerase family protein [Duncaniella freteri]|uniref:aldose epimerase family protein n=1 Tax=Duncaniella freteri TaxID=2530391 RepID=UPI00255803EB|nr:aldose epimerase family protein [Duncaniella freteri]
MSITKVFYPSPKGEITHLTLTNSNGSSVTLSTLGAGIISIIVPDSNGNMANVALGYKDAASWIADGPCAGKIPGRFANRIANGRFTLDGKEYTLAINNGPNALHGGPEGFMNRIWDISEENDGRVVMTYTSVDAEEGYPGNLTATAEYIWDDNNVLTLNIGAVTDAPTVLNLTNHVYFNLDGENSGTVLSHELKLNASRWLPTDDTQIPTGEIASVVGTPMDFTSFKAIGKDIKADFEALKIGKGYDHCWVIDGYEKGRLIPVAELRGATSGRSLIVETTQPGMQIYTGNWLAGCPESISGAAYQDYDGVAIECQGFPDAPNKPSFPSPVLRPGDEYKETIRFTFK